MGIVRYGGGFAQYSLIPPTLVDGDPVVPQVDNHGRLLVSPLAGLSTSDSQAILNSLILSIDSKTPSLIGGATPVSGAFYPATQPVTGVFWQSTQPVSGTFWQSTQPVSGTFWQSTQPVSVASLPLAAGATTAAKQDTGNISLASIDSKTPTLVSGYQPVINKYLYSSISGATTKLVKTGAGILGRVVLNTGTASSVVSIYDGTSAAGVLIATINPSASQIPSSIAYDIGVNAGITVITVGATTQVTICYI